MHPDLESGSLVHAYSCLRLSRPAFPHCSPADCVNIGGAMVFRLLRDSDALVFNFDKWGYASDLTSIEARSEAAERHTLLKVDLCDAAATAAVARQADPDLGLHLAAESHVDRSIEGPGAYGSTSLPDCVTITSNVDGTFHLLQAVRARWASATASTPALRHRSHPDQHRAGVAAPPGRPLCSGLWSSRTGASGCAIGPAMAAEGWGCWRRCADLDTQPMLIRTPVRTSRAMSDSRFEVRLNQRLADDFDQVARTSGLSRAEVFRRAIALYKTVKQEEVQQGHVILRSRDGAERELVNF